MAAVPGTATLYRTSTGTVRRAVIGTVLLLYIALTIAVMVGSPLDTLDKRLLHFDLGARWPQLHPLVSAFVVIGQRGPSTALAVPLLIWWCRRIKSTQPLIRRGLAFLLLNVSVGGLKELVGRLGPQVTVHPPRGVRRRRHLSVGAHRQHRRAVRSAGLDGDQAPRTGRCRRGGAVDPGRNQHSVFGYPLGIWIPTWSPMCSAARWAAAWFCWPCRHCYRRQNAWCTGQLVLCAGAGCAVAK